MTAMTKHRHALAGAAIVVAILAMPTAPGRTQAPTPAGDGTISTLAGTTAGFAGDGGPANQALIDTPRDVAFIAANTVLIADTANNRIRQVAPNGIITTVAGTGNPGLSGDGARAGSADLDHPSGVTSLSGGAYLIADTANNRIRKVAADGTITTVAGTTQGFGGDGGPATSAKLDSPSDTAALADGGFLIADTGNSRIRKVAADGTITTIAGAVPGFGGDGGPARSAELNHPRDVAVGSDNAILIADTANNRIRRIATDGTIATVAGGAGAGLSGDGDPAVSAQLNAPFSVAALPHGGFLFADTANNRVRRVTPLGAIFSVAGTTVGNAGNGSPAKGAKLDQPGAVTVNPSGGFLVADTANATVRAVSDVGAIPPAVPGRSVDVNPVANGTMVQPTGTQAFQPLLEKDLVPVGSQVNAVTGVIAVTSALDSTGVQQTANLFQGSFTVTQANDATQGLTTQFRLPPVTDCLTTATRRGLAHSARAHAATTKPKAKKKTTKKRKPAAKPKPRSKKTTHGLWVTETGGHWRTATGSASAVAIGTQWHTTLTCAGTRIGVHQGVVAVFDRVHQKTVVLKAGQSQLFKSVSTHQGS